MSYITHYLPELNEPERSFIEFLTSGMSHENLFQFAAAYRQVRKNPETVRLMAVIGIVAIPGLHRFWLGQVGIGVLYLLTGGLLWLGTIVDIVKYRDLAFSRNRQLARQIAINLTRQDLLREVALPDERGFVTQPHQNAGRA
jgi:TM2 domain-containing membrane protein YozV